MINRAFGLLALGLLLLAGSPVLAAGGETPRDIVYAKTPPAPLQQTREEARAKTAGCMTCHTQTDQLSMHANPGVVLGCTDCHGGNPNVIRPAGTEKGQPAYFQAQEQAHVLPRFPETWHYPSSANPKRSYTLLNKEAPEFIRFVNPSDYRIAREACGACHLPIIQAAERSLMATGAMLWGGAAYNNGILPFKNYILGEGYTREGVPANLVAPMKPTPEQLRTRGLAAALYPLPAWEVIPPGDVFRVFERGGRNIVTQFPEIGLPNSLGQLQRLEEPGRPDIRQSNRGPGTGLRIAVPVINIHKTRLNDPFMWFMGTNDQPGDFRTSGCGGCHVVYANDRDPKHSGPYYRFGNRGTTQTVDPTIPRGEQGHPLKHEFSRAIPTAQCMNCHMHQPNIFLNSMLGYTMWDYEPGAPHMYPEKQKYPTNEEAYEILMRNPEEAVLRGHWSDVKFVEKVSELNPKIEDTQFADYHGHGWNFRAIYKRDRKGNLLDTEGNIVRNDDPHKWKKAVHMSSIHVDLGFQCVDCHFAQDSHGTGHIHTEVAAAVEIRCQDCHGTATAYPSLRTTGPAARPGGFDLTLLRTQDGRARFYWEAGKLYQRSALDPKLEWEMTLVKDTVNPNHPKFNAKAARAKTISKGESQAWGPDIPKSQHAHGDEEMACFTCHLSWTTSCGGCHLPIQANWKTERHHFEGGETRNFATYNPQIVRDDMFHLGRHGTIKGGIIAPIRSTSALILSSTNINRERIYIHQTPVAASGYSSQAFAPHYPHTERKEETKTCTDCHLSDKNDNNAIVAQTLLHGTNYINFMGYNAWVGQERGLEAIQVTEWDEPQSVIGSYLHRYAYPDWFKQHQDRGLQLPNDNAFGVFGHGSNPTGCLQNRGEYLFVAEGPGGIRVYDIASIGNKGISQRIITAPFSPLGHDAHIRTKNATCLVMPTTQPIAPWRNQGELMRVTNQEQPFHPIYNYAFVTDSEEGLIAFDINTFTDGEARNNFIKRAVTWNENNVLKGARHLSIAGYYFYVVADAGLVVVNMDDPLKPKLEAVVRLDDARAAMHQFRYLFVTDRTGLRVIDVTLPDKPRLLEDARVPIRDAQKLHIARTFAYVAAKDEGLVIVDVENPEKPKVYMTYTADGQINDARDVFVAGTNASVFAYVADGKNGLKVIQLTAPDTQPNFYGFAPDPKPQLIAWQRTKSVALSLARPLERDRGVDETGGQVAIFGRIGSRPFTLEEQRKLFLDKAMQPWFVTDQVRMDDYRGPPIAAPVRRAQPPQQRRGPASPPVTEPRRPGVPLRTSQPATR